MNPPGMSEASDLELVMLVAGANQQAAFRELVQRHQPAIRRFLRRLAAGDQATADDLAQESFLLAYRKIDSWRSNGTFSSWLHTIAYRQFLAFARKRKRLAEVSDLSAHIIERGFDPASAIEAELITQKLMSLVSAEERACLTLAFAAGMSHSEICSITALPLGTVKSRIQRGRQKLQTWLEEHDHFIQKSGKIPKKEALHA